MKVLVGVMITSSQVGGAKYCDGRVCMSVRSHVSKTTMSKLHTTFSVRVNYAVARSSSGDSAIRYVLLDLWMTSWSEVRRLPLPV